MGNKTRRNARESLDVINASLTILDKLENENTDGSFSINMSINPFYFVMKLLTQFVSYEDIVKYLSYTIVCLLPAIELSVKLKMIESLKDLFSCSVNPFISRQMILEGVVFDLRSVDLLNILSFCPLDTNTQKSIGKMFYSDTEDFNFPDELVNCPDFNAFLWYVKNRAIGRSVWYGTRKQNTEHELLTQESRPRLKDGIITLEYSPRPNGLKDSVGQPMSIQVPHGDCLHVFLGNAKEIINVAPISFDNVNRKIEDFNDTIFQLEEVMKATEAKTDELMLGDYNLANDMLACIKDNASLVSRFPNMLVKRSNGKRIYQFDSVDMSIMMDENTYQGTLSQLENEKSSLIVQGTQATLDLSPSCYRAPNKNYFYHKSLFDFNLEYIMSVKLFDAKVVTASLIEAMTKFFTLDFAMSIEDRMMRKEVEEMVNKVITTGDSAVNDCFFSFSNEDWNIMLDNAEKERSGLYTGDDTGYGARIDYDKILEQVNSISEAATQEEQITVISGALMEISRAVSSNNREDGDSEFNFEFVNNMLKNLCYVLVCSIVSPKMYLLMSINLKLMGQEPNFDLHGFITSFKTMLVKMVRTIVDDMMNYMKEWLMSLVNELAKKLSEKLLLEQAEYYIRLLTRCIRCFRLYGYEDWNMADVQYADIYGVEEDEPINNEC